MSFTGSAPDRTLCSQIARERIAVTGEVCAGLPLTQRLDLTRCFPGLRALKLFQWSTMSSSRRRRNATQRPKLPSRRGQRRSTRSGNQVRSLYFDSPLPFSLCLVRHSPSPSHTPASLLSRTLGDEREASTMDVDTMPTVTRREVSSAPLNPLLR